MDTRNLSPGVIVAVIVVVVAIAGFLLWRGTSTQVYTGPPIDMGAAMRGGASAPGPGAAPAPASQGKSR
jgi:hypothetical protein